MMEPRINRASGANGRLRCATAACLALTMGLGGCGLISLFEDDCGFGIRLPSASDQSLSAISLGLRYLVETQFASDQTGYNKVAYAGDWPQCCTMEASGLYARDTNPFMATYVHHALTLVRAENQAVLGLTDAEIDAARGARRAAVDLMLRFGAEEGRPDAGTYGFWPIQRPRWRPGDWLLSAVVNRYWTNWQGTGDRQPVNFSFFPSNHAPQSDADDTASIYAVLLDHARLDGGPDVAVRFERFFADWRDSGQIPLGSEPSWLSPGRVTGAYLTWLAYLDDANHPSSNHVDLVVNANVLYALGRCGRLDTPGVTESVTLINEAVATGVHRSNPSLLSLFYPDNLAFHYCVARAYAEGGVSGLAPAVDGLVQDLLDTVRVGDAGQRYWSRGDPHLNTAFAVAALLSAGVGGDVVDAAVNYLLAQQNPDYGSWDSGPFFGARLPNGTWVTWVSPALTTAIALEAIMKHRIAE